MKFCQNHWDALRDAICDRGLESLVAPNGRAVVYRLKQELDGVATNSNYDPLMDAHNMICAKALEYGGLYLLYGEYCPLCELEEHAPKDIDASGVVMEWINGCTDSILEYCKENSLI